MDTFVIDAEHGIRILGSDGWRQPTQGEYIETDGGNYITVNAENYWCGIVQGFAAGTLCALFAIGIVAVIVAG